MTEDIALARVTFLENISKIDNYYDRFLLILYLMGWKQEHIADVLGQRKQSVQYRIRKCRKMMGIYENE